jgi:hypothetical protein
MSSLSGRESIMLSSRTVVTPPRSPGGQIVFIETSMNVGVDETWQDLFHPLRR